MDDRRTGWGADSRRDARLLNFYRWDAEAVRDDLRCYVLERLGVWVPNWSSTSRDLGIFVYQPAEQITTSEVNLGW